ncbi:MAG: hypothetical protein JST38_04490 [Bacteroidetes bacterium]|nr:hypothetical protein [Bacteroidota bacterium]
MSEKELLRITRSRLIERLKKVEDLGLLTHMDSLLEPGSEAWWSSLPTKVKASVLTGIEQADKGEFVSDEEVRKVRAQWRNP